MAAIKITPITSNSGKGLPRNREEAVARGLSPAWKGEVLNPRGANNSRAHFTIRDYLNKISDEDCPGELLTVYRKFWPTVVSMTMKEAWLRITYMEAIGGNPSAWYFIADRLEGKVTETGIGNNKGLILSAIDQMIENPVTEDQEE